MPGFGIAGGGIAVVGTHLLIIAILTFYVLTGRTLVRPRMGRLRWPLFTDILKVGAVASVSTLQTSLTIGMTTALVGSAGGPDAVAGFGVSFPFAGLGQIPV